jgi:PPP family 3-phenylpropionic acid transporter
MPLDQAVQRISPELRTSAFYFVHFTAGGAVTAYGGIWFAGQGLSAGEIGIINALPTFIMLALTLLVGRLADRASDWRQVIVIGALIAAIMPIGLFFAHGFAGILTVWTLLALPAAAIAPVADAASLRMTTRNGSDFGVIRAWGTVGFMATNAATGFVVALFGPGGYLPFYVGLNLLRGLVALALPKFRAPPPEETVAAVTRAVTGGRGLREVLRPWFLLPLIGISLILSMHIIVNAFGALLWKEQGVPEAIIGPLMALASLAEAVTMFAWRRLGIRLSARAMMLTAGLFSVLRWAAMGLAPPVWVLFPLQLLQSLTYAIGLLGSVHFIAKWTSEEIAAEVQGFFVMLQQIAQVVALAGFGWLIGQVGAAGYFAAGALALAGAACIWVSMRLKAPTA